MAGSFFYYVTYKYVLLKDARLGVLYYLLATLILLYTLVEIFIRKGYLEFDMKPQGTVKLTLSDEFANKTFSPRDLPYCHGNVSCRYTDPWDLSWPVESRAVTITTLSKDRLQQLTTDSATAREEYNIVSESVYYTPDSEASSCRRQFFLGAEYVVLKVDHAVVATQFTDGRGRERLASSHRRLWGFLAGAEGEMVREFPPQPGKPDKVTLHELLSAAGVKSLDEESDAVNARGRSFRERGCILRVTIFYQNWFNTWFGTNDIDYTYRVRRVPYVSYSSKQVQPLASLEEVVSHPGSQPKWRLLRKRHCVRVEFEQAGSLGMLSLSTLLLKLVSGMGLLTLTATVIDTLALYVLPDRRRYRSSVFEESAVLKSTKIETKDTKND